MQSMNIYLVTGKDHCGFSVADRPILCVKLFYGKP